MIVLLNGLANLALLRFAAGAAQRRALIVVRNEMMINTDRVKTDRNIIDRVRI